jgi:hypothetical protein
MPKDSNGVDIAQLVVAAAVLRIERWRFTYGRKLTPDRIADFVFPSIGSLENWVRQRLQSIHAVTDAALNIYSHLIHARQPAPRVTAAGR